MFDPAVSCEATEAEEEASEWFVIAGSQLCVAGRANELD